MDMKKLILFLTVAFCLLASAQQTLFGQAALRVFMQPDGFQGSAVQYGNNANAGHYVQADDARIYYEVYGKGEPVLVLHGGMVGCAYEMGQFIDSLSTKYQVIAVSTRGHGRSEIGHKPVTYEQRANDALAALNAVTDKPAALVLGFSDGAYTAYKLASMYPGRVKKLIALGAGENLRLLRKVQGNNVGRMKEADPAFMQNLLAMTPEPERLQEYWDDLKAFYNDRMIADKKLLNSIKCPTLLISGELDSNAPLETVLNAYKMIPNCSLAIIQGAPHQVMITNFPAVWANIAPFLKCYPE